MRRVFTLCSVLAALIAGCATADDNSTQQAADDRSSEILNRLDTRVNNRPARIAAVHMGGNWGTNRWGGVESQPEGYFEYLQQLNVNWVGVSVALHVSDSMDSNVRRVYAGNDASFTDDQLIRTIRFLRNHGFKVYLTLALETSDMNVAHPVQRWQFGDPGMPKERADIDPGYWPWSLEHPDHTLFVRKFFASYTNQAVAVGKLAQAEGVEMYSLGTETERLFRTRTGGRWPNDFRKELATMVDAVREVYGGLLTYDMASDAVSTANDFYDPGSSYLFHDLKLDIIGVSAYFPLYDSVPGAVPTVPDLENKWQGIFKRYLSPHKLRNDNLPMIFLEFGYVDSVDAVVRPANDELAQRTFLDRDKNGLDDGQETQANVYQALFNVMQANQDLLNGAFLWGMTMADDGLWNGFGSTGATKREFSVRGKLAEQVVWDVYGTWRD
jgi:hypothetical protein